MRYICPVCSFPNLHLPPRSKSGAASHDICPSCGFQFGYTDDSKGFSYDEWREKWMDKGMPWMSKRAKPDDWDPRDFNKKRKK